MDPADPKGPPPLPDARTLRVRSFQEEAGRVIAQSGGLTAGCQVKLMALGAKMGLSEDEVREAIGSLQAAPSTWIDGSGEQARREHFRQHLADALAGRQVGLLLPGEEKQLADEGRRPPFSLARSAARRIVRQVARQKRLGLVSPRDARLHVARLVREVMGDSPSIDPEARTRVHREGEKYGLTPGHVELILRKQEKENRRQYLANLIAPAMAGLAVLVVAVFFAVLLFPRRPAARPRPVEAPVVHEATGGDWWDVALVLAVGKARVTLPGLKPILKRMESTDPAARGAAYEALMAELTRPAQDEPGSAAPGSEAAPEGGPWEVTVLDAVPPSKATDDEAWWPNMQGESPVGRIANPSYPATVLDDAASSDVVRQILVACHALEPSDASAERLRNALLGLIPRPESEATKELPAPTSAFWAVETAIAALEHPQLDAKRADALAQAIASRLGIEMDRRLMPDEQIKHCMGALCLRLYKTLIAAAASRPDRVREQVRALRDRAEKYLDPATLDSLDAELLFALLPAAPDTWREHRSTIRRVAASESWESLRRLVDLYERCGNRELQDYLTGMFLVRFNLDLSDTSVSAVAAEVRKRIDEASRSPAERFERCASRVLADTPGTGHTGPDAGSLLQAAVSLAKVATLGCALAQGDAGRATFDRLLAAIEHGEDFQGAGLASDASGSDAASRPPRWVDECVGRLAASAPQSAGARLSSLNRLTQDAGSVRDLTPEQGAAVARYLLVPKPREEYEEMRYQVGRVGRWNSVRLGLADELAGMKLGTSALQQERILEVVSEVLGREVAAEENEAWRRTQERLTRMLLREVYDSLASADRPGQEGEPGAQMQELYATQARLLGVPSDDYAGAATPAAVLQLMIAHYAKQLDQAHLRAEDRKRVDRLPHDLAVVDYLGDNDLARTVLLQRVWARLLAAGAIGQNPGRTATVEQLLRKLDESDRNAEHVLVQLREGERTLVELWTVFVGAVPVETMPKNSP